MNSIRVSNRRWRLAVLLAVWFLVTFFSAAAWAQVNYNWVGGVGVQDWGTATNWDPIGVPGAGDTAYLEPNDAINRLAAFNNIHPVGTSLNVISVNGLGTGDMTLQLGVAAPAGDLRAGTMYLGTNGWGFLNQSNGAATITEYLILGEQAVGSGTYTLSGGTLTANVAYIGDNGTGSFVQSETSGPSTVTVTNMGIGRSAGGNGTYRLNAGTLTINENLYVGALGTGTFIQAGGTPTITGSIILGEGNTGIGTYNLQAGTLAPQYLDVGQQGIGRFIQSPGTTLTIAGNLMVNSQSQTDFSAFTQEGGTTTVLGHLGVGRDPNGPNGDTRYNLQGGTLNTGNLFVGYQGIGTFNQTGGSHIITDDVYLAELNTGQATYNLQAGTLTVTNPGAGVLYVGNQGIATFNQSTGTTLDVRWLFVNSQAGTSVVTQAGGTTTVANHLGVGRDPNSHGEYNFQGDSLTIGDLYVGFAGNGAFNQSGGTLTVIGSESVGHMGTGIGAFTQTAGSHTVGGNLALGFEAGSAGTFDLSGAASTLAVTGDEVVGHTGTGTFTQSGGTHTVGGDLAVGFATGGAGSYIQSGGTNTVTGSLFLGQSTGSTGTYTLSGTAGLSANYLGIGFNGGVGTFTQDGGTNTVATFLTLGVDAGSNGTYNLNGGSLATNFDDIGWSSTATVNQSGGTHTLSMSFNLGWTATGVGNYTMTGGSLSSTGNDVFIGYEGRGAFTQSGGTHTTAFDLYVGHQATGIGRYDLSSTGSLAVGDREVIGLFGTGTFTQTGGTHTVASDLVLGLEATGTGTFELSDTGSLAVSGSEAIGFSGRGTFTQTGGTHTVGGLGLGLGVNATGNGTFNLGGGTLTVTGDMGVGLFGTGTFNQTGGSNTITNNLILAFDAGSSGTYTLGGGTLTAAAINLNAGGVFNQTGGTLNFTTFNQTGGALTTINPIVGNVGAGDFTQSGGTHTVTGSLTLAANPGSTGIYNLEGGTLTAPTININTGGLFHHTGGNLNFTTLNLPGGTFQGDLDFLGTVTGNGTIQGNYTNRGTVNPGNSAGTLNVAGSYTQAATGTYRLEIASASSYDQIKITGAPGTATVNGTLSPVLLGGFTPAWNQVFPGIITASGGVSGTFRTIDSLLSWQVRYNTNSIDLISGGRNFADPSLPLTANQRHVGVMLNEVANTASGDLAKVLTALSALPAGQVGDAYQQISPDKTSALPALSLAGSMMQWQSLANRLSYQRWRQGGLPNLAGGRSGSFNLSYDKLAGLMLAYNGADLSGMGSALRPPADSAGTWGVFTDFVSSFGSLDSTANDTGYNFTIFGFTAGADYRLRDDLVIGLGTGYYNTSASYKNSGGDAGINSIPFYAYGAYTPGSFYAMGSLGYTLNLYSLDRNIVFGGINRVATSSVNGNQLNVSLETGYDFKVAQFTLTPALTVYYSQAWVNGFTESGAGSLDLNVNSQSANSVQTGLGMRLSRPCQSGSTLILPQIYAFYQHEFANDSRGLDARLAQAGSTFAFQTDSPSRDFALLGAGVAVGLRKNLTLQANYNAEVGRRGYTPMMVSAGLRYEF